MDTSTDRDQYDEWMDELERAIRLKRELRDAQQDGDEHHRRIQGEATRLTAQLDELQRAAPRLRELDGQIQAASSRSRGVQFRLDEQRKSATRFAGFAGVTAVAVLLVCMAFPVAWWAWAIGLVALAGAVAGGLYSTQQQLNPPDELRELQTEEAQLRNERKRLMPQ